MSSKIQNQLHSLHRNTERIRSLFKRTDRNEERSCRICLDTDIEITDKWIHPCSCKGSIKWCHHSCLQIWLDVSNRRECDFCKSKYKIIDRSNPLKQYSSEISWVITIGVVLSFFYGVQSIFKIKSIWNSQFIRLTYIGLALILTAFDFGLSLIHPDFYIEINTHLIDDTVQHDSLLFVFIYMYQLIHCLYSKIPWGSNMEILNFD